MAKKKNLGRYSQKCHLCRKRPIKCIKVLNLTSEYENILAKWKILPHILKIKEKSGANKLFSCTKCREILNSALTIYQSLIVIENEFEEIKTRFYKSLRIIQVKNQDGEEKLILNEWMDVNIFNNEIETNNKTKNDYDSDGGETCFEESAFVTKKEPEPSAMQKTSSYLLHPTYNNKYPCQYCPLTFPKYELMKKHVRKHVNLEKFDALPENAKIGKVRPEAYKCEYCEAFFSQKSSIHTHTVKVHPDESKDKIVRCPIRNCTGIFHNQMFLNYHVVKYHPELRTDFIKENQCQYQKKSAPNQIENDDDYFNSFFNDDINYDNIEINHGPSSSTLLNKNDEKRLIPEIDCEVVAEKRRGQGRPLNKIRQNSVNSPKKASSIIIRPVNTKISNSKLKSIIRPIRPVGIMKRVKRQNHKCPDCNEEFKSILKLKIHKKTFHPIVKPDQVKLCAICGENDCKEHKSKKYKKQCKICGISLYHLTIHMKTHEDTVYQCEFCGKSFKKDSSLKSHLETHQNIQVPCREPSCSKVFSCKNSMRNHYCANHTSTLICEICGKSLTRNKLNKHLREVHCERNFKCQLCSYAAKTSTNLGIHYKHSHKNEITLPN